MFCVNVSVDIHNREDAMSDSRYIVRHENRKLLGDIAPKISIKTLDDLFDKPMPDLRENSHNFIIWAMQVEELLDLWIGRALNHPRRAYTILGPLEETIGNVYIAVVNQLCRAYYVGREIVEVGPGQGWSLNSLTLVVSLKLIYLQEMISGMTKCIETLGADSIPKRYETPAVLIEKRTVRTKKENASQRSVDNNRVPLMPMRMYGRDFAGLYEAGQLCYPHEQIGTYSQVQLQMQLECLVRSAGWVSVKNEEFRRMLTVLMIRLAELVVTPHKYGSLELDGGENSRICALFHGANEDPSHQSDSTIVLKSIDALNIASMERNKREDAIKRREDLFRTMNWMPSVRYIMRVGFMIASTKMAYNAYKLSMYENDEISDEAIKHRIVVDAMMVYVKRVAEHIAERAGVNNFGLSMGGRGFIDNIIMEETQYRASNRPTQLRDARLRLRHTDVVRAFDQLMNEVRDRVTESKYLTVIGAQCRLSYLYFGGYENAMIQAGMRNTISDAEVERYSYSHESRQYMTDTWSTAHIREYDRPEYNITVKMTAWAWVFQSLTLTTITERDGAKWVDTNYFTDKRFLKAYSLKPPHINRQPFIFTIYGSLFVWHAGSHIACETPLEALLFWVLLTYHTTHPDKRPAYLCSVMEKITERMAPETRRMDRQEIATLERKYSVTQ